MFIHIGGERMIRSSEIVAIFDLSIEESSKVSRQFIQHAHKDKRVEVISEDESKSLVVTVSKLYYSPISSITLKKRTHQGAIL